MVSLYFVNLPGLHYQCNFLARTASFGKKFCSPVHARQRTLLLLVLSMFCLLLPCLCIGNKSGQKILPRLLLSFSFIDLFTASLSLVFPEWLNSLGLRMLFSSVFFLRMGQGPELYWDLKCRHVSS